MYPKNALSHVPASPLPFPASASSNIIATVLMLPHDGPGGACSRAGTEEEAAARKACWRSRHMDASCWKEPALILVRQAACNRACTRFRGAGRRRIASHAQTWHGGRPREGWDEAEPTNNSSVDRAFCEQLAVCAGKSRAYVSCHISAVNGSYKTLERALDAQGPDTYEFEVFFDRRTSMR